MLALALLNLLALLVLIWRRRSNDFAQQQLLSALDAQAHTQAAAAERQAQAQRSELHDSARATRQELQASLGLFQQSLQAQAGDLARTQNEQTAALRSRSKSPRLNSSHPRLSRMPSSA